jgi:acyl dehydratase
VRREIVKAVQPSGETLDTSDVDKYIGKSVGGGQLKEPITVTDIRRWVQAMDYPNPVHFDEKAAERTPTGLIVGSQSFTACCDVGHGSVPAIVGRIPGSHVVFGGDEWWFYGPRILPGDRVRVQRKFDGYSMADTRFAGPTMFSRGDTLYLNQRKEPVAKQRCTMVRYRADLARARGYYDQIAKAPQLSAELLRDVARRRNEWIRSGEGGAGPGSVKAGHKLPTRAMGPHSIATFTSEYRALIFGVWGSHYYEGNYMGLDAGWLPELMGEETSDAAAKVSMDDGPASGHTNLDKAKLVGLPRHYGYGSSMGAWVLDYAAYWAGDSGFIRHAKIDYRFPVFEGDVTFIDGEVTDARFDPLLGVQVASLRIKMTNQDGTVMSTGGAVVELSRL